MPLFKDLAGGLHLFKRLGQRGLPPFCETCPGQKFLKADRFFVFLTQCSTDLVLQLHTFTSFPCRRGRKSSCRLSKKAPPKQGLPSVFLQIDTRRKDGQCDDEKSRARKLRSPHQHRVLRSAAAVAVEEGVAALNAQRAKPALGLCRSPLR
jgi:hypothetical protein